MEYRRRNKLHKRIAFRRRLQVLRTLTKSNLVKTSAIIMDAYFYISALKLKLETLKRENMSLIKHIDNQQSSLEVNVEKLARNGYKLTITRKNNGREILVNILHAFEVMNINVINAKVSCNGHFSMEAIVEPCHNAHQVIDSSVLTQLVLKTIEGTSSS